MILSCLLLQIMPILSSFCVYGTIGIFALFVIQSTFFPACLTLDQKRIQSSRSGCVPCYTHKNYKPNKYSNRKFLAPFFKKVWGPACISGPGKVSSICMECPTLINWTNLFPFKGLLSGIFHFYYFLNRTFLKQTVETLIRSHILWLTIWVFTVCDDP